MRCRRHRPAGAHRPSGASSGERCARIGRFGRQPGPDGFRVRAGTSRPPPRRAHRLRPTMPRTPGSDRHRRGSAGGRCTSGGSFAADSRVGGRRGVCRSRGSRAVHSSVVVLPGATVAAGRCRPTAAWCRRPVGRHRRHHPRRGRLRRSAGRVGRACADPSGDLDEADAGHDDQPVDRDRQQVRGGRRTRRSGRPRRPCASTKPSRRRPR
jgi:hypothetical protein